MDYSITFARHFSRLVWLLLHEPGNVEEQKAALRAIATIAKDGAITFASADWRLVVNGTPLPEALLGVQDLVAQLIGHAVVELSVAQGAAAADLLGVARLLASEPVPGDGGRSVLRKLHALGARTVKLTVQSPPGDSPTGEPPSGPARGAAKAPPAREQTGAGRARRSGPTAGAHQVLGLMKDTTTRRYLAFAAVPQPRGTAREILAKLDAARSVNSATRLLDELVLLAESSAREGLTSVVADAFCGVVQREAALDDGDLRQAYTMAIRRMSKPTLLRLVAMLLPRHRENSAEYLAVLARTGEEGADALIEQLTAAQSLADRRIYFDTLLELNAGVSALVHMLGDARWYVARNAADLLGEMQATEADIPLAELLKHDDERVRRAATTALAKLGTGRARQALRDALRDTSPQVRMQAATGVGGRKNALNAVTLLQAFDDESDGEVQFAIVAALGRLATDDAVRRLIDIATTDGGLFRRRPITFRLAAIQALGEARTPAAMTALEELVKAKEKELREAALKAMTSAQRSSLAASA